MKMRIKTDNICQYVGNAVAGDVKFNGFMLVEKGELITEDLAKRLSKMSDQIPEIDVDNKSVAESKSADILIKKLYPKVQAVMERYSFEDENEEDNDKVFGIMESIVGSLSKSEGLGELDLDSLLLSKPDLCAHSLNCAVIAALLSIKSSRFQKWMIEQITLGALLHDVGLAVLMDRHGVEWTELPFDIKKEHPVIGYNLLKDNSYISDSVKKIVLMHHVWEKPEESFDEGVRDYMSYPMEYEGNKIYPQNKSLSVSIVQVSDAFERLTNKLAGRGMLRREALKDILNNAERIYGQGSILLFSYVSPYSVGEIVKLSSGKEARVVKQTSSIFKPIVQYLGKSSQIDLRKWPFLKIVD